jgi:glycogen debranching enzyme
MSSAFFDRSIPAESLVRPSRRAMLGALGAGLAALALPRGIAAASALPKWTHAQIEELLKPILRTDSPQLFEFAVTVYERCVLGRMQPADAPIRHPWLVPGGYYVGQWIWDTTFLTDLLAVLPGQQEFIRGIYENFWEFQQRWKRAKPDYAQGMIANFISPDSGPPGFTGKDWLTFPAYSQAPLLGWGVERVFNRNHDMQLVREALGPLEEFHDWYWRERDLDNVGLITVGVYDGSVRHAHLETYDFEADLDTLQLIPHPGRAEGPNNGAWYGDIYIPANTAYLLLSEASLIRLAKAAGDHKLAARRKPILKKGIEAMRAHMWDETQGCFLAVHRQDLRKIQTATIGSFVPVQAGVPTARLAARMAEALLSPHWNTPLPFPTVDRLNPAYKSDSFWCGDFWPAPAFQTLEGMARYGYGNTMGPLADRVLANAMKMGVSEHYDTQSGAPLGVKFLGMSAVLLTIALEGLSPKYSIRIAS